MSKKCRFCGELNENPLLPFCKQCYYSEVRTYDIRKPINKVSEKKKQRMKENGSEVQLFQEIWNERDHICEVCNKYIQEPKGESFSHILSKGRYPALRYNKKNIALVCSIECHKEHDRMNAGNDLQLIHEILGK